MSLYPSKRASFTSTERIFASGPFSSSIIKAPITRTLAMLATSKGSKDKVIMSNGSLSMYHVFGTNPYSTGNTTEEGMMRSKTKASQSDLYSYLSREPLMTSITMFSSSGGLSPVGILFHKFNAHTLRASKKLREH